ncbi:MAG: chemotaxis protein CheB [Bacteroidota bacterium]|jgi:two-component system CheB/CheR fusion protein|nr:PAS domain-containing protein [Ignavibacteria bacterium]HEX2962475.1 chemotaxis protein CheB [Ignavibacteriales bacterium]MCU7500853.1 PAS domain-containing protein [Ignavibacteria bacterium]MCU7511768.1 PAS domain-containing protein [Ignavibacteria bacterium]MCU7520668.1 PAS domain-containing protein [Ignavibacteria bacterium]
MKKSPALSESKQKPGGFASGGSLRPELGSQNKSGLEAEEQFPVVGIGASAGGLEALEQFFTNVNQDSGMAFVVIQHLDPNYKGMMPELLQRFTPMHVLQAKDGLRTKPNTVYVIPPNKSMSVLNRTLHLFAPVEKRGLRLPIDYFFSSLADDLQEKSIGIVLSGMGSDGATGLRSIKEKGGIVLVQDPAAAKYSGMPRSAIEAVVADFVAPADELAGKLQAFFKHARAVNSISTPEGIGKNALEKIIILLRAQTGHDFSLYKKASIYRRIERRMTVHKIDTISHYIRFLQENQEELEILFKELLIGVTNFFRDPVVWEYLKEKIFPPLFEKLPARYVLRAWVAACSTGEEAYSLAIVFREALDLLKQNNRNLKLQIFATDLDADAVNKARKGFFPANISSDISPERLNRFFTPSEGGFCVKPEIREMVVFAQQNVTKDPPFTKLDLLLCRNLLIYLEPELQKSLISLFHYSLNPGGVLILGSSESNSDNRILFKSIEPKLRIYRRLVSTVPRQVELPASDINIKTDPVKKYPNMKATDNMGTLADQLMLQKFAPASVLVNSDGDILYITGRTGNYLEPSSGRANMNIFAMARSGLRNELPMVFHRALKNYQKTVLRNVEIRDNEKTYCVDLTVQKIEKPDALRDLVMVVFSEVTQMKEKEPLKSKGGKSLLKNSPDNLHNGQLQLELQKLKKEMQNSFEVMQTSQEELRSANEELQSTNEELQSTNEELTTSKEEMQSLNEELQTVNFELQSKVDEFTVVNNDMNNLLNSIDIATLFLDRELHIRRFTKQTTKIFKLIQSDIGRSFTDQVSDLEYPEILNDATEVLRTLIPLRKDVVTNDGRWFEARIMPYRTMDDRIDGLVITFTDITKAKNLEAELNKTIAILRSHNLDSYEKK